MKKTSTKTNPIIALEIQIEVCRKNKELLQNQIKEVINTPQQVKVLTTKLFKIEEAYRKIKSNRLLKFDSAYIETKARLKDLKKTNLLEQLELLNNQFKKEQQRHESLKQSLFQKLEFQRQQLLRKQKERAVCEENKRKKEQNNWKRSHSNLSCKKPSRNGGSKRSSISAIYGQTQYGSVWPYRK